MNPKNFITDSRRVPPDEQVAPQDILAILDKHGNERSALMSILGEIQDKYRYLPESALRMVAEKTGCALVDIYAAATFYHAFSLEPKGKHIVSVCLGTACHVRGGRSVAEEFERQLNISAGETTPDREFTLETVNCLGACALGPIVLVDGKYFSKVDRKDVKQIINEARNGINADDTGFSENDFPVKASCPHCNKSLMNPDQLIHGHPSIELIISFEQKRSWVRYSRIYGFHKVQTEHEIPADTTVDLLCPHCSANLLNNAVCTKCGAAMAHLKISGGGRMGICSRSGCDEQTLDLDDPVSGLVNSGPAVLNLEVHSSGG